MHRTPAKWVATGVFFSALASSGVQGQTAEALMDVLVRKGILTEQESEDIKSDLHKENRSHNRWNFTTTTKTLTIGGDFRGRFEGFYSDNPAFVDRNRFRYRLRAGLVGNLGDNLEMGFRLTSGERVDNFGGDPISPNATFSDNASKKFGFIDLAYGRYTFSNSPEWSSTWTFGKMENPFLFSDMVFDPDYTPEGLAQQFLYTLTEQHTVRLNLAGFILEEVGASSLDSYLLGAQVRFDSKWNQRISTAFGVSGLAISGTEALAGTPASPFTGVPDLNQGNTRTPAPAPGASGPGGELVFNYNPIVVDAALTYSMERFPFYAGAFPIRLQGEFMHNPAAPTRNNGYWAGVAIGRSGRKGLWDLSYRYKVLEGDAWWEEVVDSDFGGFYQAAPSGGRRGYGSGTNVRGHIVRASYSPLDALTVGISYFLTELIEEVPPGSDSQISRVQMDALWRF